MESITTISEFLAAGETDWQVFELGRRVQPLANDTFAAIERDEQPWPFARQQQAWLGIAFWHRQKPQQHYVWFLKLPLDERNLLQHAARQHFLSIVTDALGQQPTQDPTAEQAKLMNQNPYIWQPDEHRRGAFHAQVSVRLQLPPSVYFEEAESFCRQTPPGDWQNLGLQGLHDVAARSLQQTAIQQNLPQLMRHTAAPCQQILAETLEHHTVPDTLGQNLLAQCRQHQEPEQRLRLLRACASLASTPAFQQTSRQLLQELTGPAHSELLLVLAARCWPALTQHTLLATYLDQLASQPPALFGQIFRDLVCLPELRAQLLTTLREPPTPKVQEAIHALIQQARAGQS